MRNLLAARASGAALVTVFEPKMDILHGDGPAWGRTGRERALPTSCRSLDLVGSELGRGGGGLGTDMAWISLPDDRATPQLTRLTQPYRDQGRAVPEVVAVMKPNPAALRAVLKLNYAVTFGGSELGRRDEEVIATAVSALNECFY